jgi:hypothetical protein
MKKKDVAPSSQNSNADIGETVLEELAIVDEIMKADDNKQIVPPVIRDIGVPNGNHNIDSQISESNKIVSSFCLFLNKTEFSIRLSKRLFQNF